MILFFLIPRTPLITRRAIFSVSATEKGLKGRRHENRGYSGGWDDEAHRHSERSIHQLLSGLGETLATLY
jgi:hypothetical protein